jgi:predicted small integral membrane protein
MIRRRTSSGMTTMADAKANPDLAFPVQQPAQHEPAVAQPIALQAVRIIKTGLVAGMAVLLTITTLNNILMPAATYGAISLALGMQTTFRNPMEIWRAVVSPAALWTIAVIVIAAEALGAALLWVGAVRLWLARSSAAQFNQAKGMALIGLTFIAGFYFIGWLVVCNEWFGMWQSTKMNVLPDAFRLFGEGMLIAIWLNTADT